MSKHVLLTVFCFVVLSCTSANAQNPCPTGVASDKLVCLVPQVYGVNGLVLANSLFPTFQNVLPESLTPLNSSVAKQAALLPLASPSSGITYSWDPTTQTQIRSTDSFGPILGERSETIGKHRVFLGFDYQYFKFDSVDGVDLKNLPAVFTQQDDSVDVSGRTCSVNGDNKGDCAFIRDVVRTKNRLDLKIQQFTTFVTFGLTDQIDVSIAIPIENVRMGMFSTATIVHNDSPTRFVHSFAPRPGCGAPCFDGRFSNVGTASGIGDITVRVKGTAWKGERAGLALGVDVRTPTGDSFNFLGAGTAGIKPFGVWSYRSRVSPHIQVGYEVNGSSAIAGDISTGKKERLPGQLTYSGGADIWLTKSFTAAFDLVGQQVFQARRTVVGTLTEPGACDSLSCNNPSPAHTDPDLSQKTESYNITNASVGVKIKPFHSLVMIGNVLIKLNEGGLRAKFVPLVGISYTF
jgi:hypothetical protein